MKAIIFYLLTFLVVSTPAFAQTALFSYGSSWRYLDNGSDQGTSWKLPSFDDASWSTGLGVFGYGHGNEATIINYGPNSSNKYITTYFRKTISVPDTSQFKEYVLNIKRDDGAVVYINGLEVYRSNMGSSTPTYTTLASTFAADDGNTPQTKTLALSQLKQGANVIAVEIHQSSAASPDIVFDMELLANTTSNKIVQYGDTWKYFDQGIDLSTTWQSESFDDASWAQGPAILGYGHGDEATVVSYGPSATSKYITTYFRKTLNIPDISQFTGYTLNIKRDDGAVVYINGVEVFRTNMPAGTIAYTTLASANASDNGTTPQTQALSSSALKQGTNVIAVEIHQYDKSSSDIVFDLDLTATTAVVTPPPVALVIGPYMNIATTHSIIIKWKTDVATDSKVAYGTTPGIRNQSVTDAASTTNHSVTLTGLTPGTVYYYSIGTTSLVLQGDGNNYFKTAPVAGSKEKVRILAMGDMGAHSTIQSSVLKSYLNYNKNNVTDIWMLLGDNAYESGLATEFQNYFFNPYQGSLTKNHVIWPAPGNHDYANDPARQADHNVAYYDVFSMPTNGEAGGVPSGTEAYYSYDYANIHFVSLDSYGWEANNTRLYDTTGPQVTWLKQDLAANTQKWTVVYFHHPPYSKGSHNSDTETELIELRENLVRILERYKVDFVICGHSHAYERSYLINGHYGLANTFNPATMALSTSSGKYDGSTNSCLYTKQSTEVRNGIVYAEVGSSAVLGGSTPGYPHPAMNYSNITSGGSMLIEIEDNRLDAKWISSDGIVADKFTLMKDVGKTIDTTINAGDNLTLTASWLGNYTWSTGGTARSVTVAPSSDSTFTVSDNAGCLNDVFHVIVSGGVPALAASLSADSIGCHGGTTNVIVSASGGVTPYTGTGTFTANAGLHQYTVTDAAGASTTVNITLGEPGAIDVDEASTTHTDVSCNGTATGSISLGTVSGGTAPYSYRWTKTGDANFSASTANISNLTAGTYNYSVTDANTCTPATGSVTIAQPDAYTITATAGPNGSISPSGVTTVSCNGSQSYTITPDACYQIEDVLIDGTSDASAITNGSYVFSNVTASHTISVTFKSSSLANAGTISGTTPLCVGATATYTTDGSTGGSWSSTNTAVATVNASTGLVTAVAAGSTDIVYSVAACSGTVSNAKSLTVTTCAEASITCPANVAAKLVSGCSRSLSVANPTISNTTTLTWVMTGATTGASPSTGINYVGTKTFNRGVTTVVYTAQGSYGGSATCQFTVTINDPISPRIACPANITQKAGGFNCSKSISVPNPTVSDNCTVTTLTWTMSGATVGASATTGINYVGTRTFNVGTTTITYTAKDQDGNTATCSFTVTVNNSKCIATPTATAVTGGSSTDLSAIPQTESPAEMSVLAFPNPTLDAFTVLVTSASKEKVQVWLTDILGRRVYSARVSVEEAITFGKNLSGGMYILRVTQGNNIRLLKLIKTN